MCWAPSLLDVNSALCCNYRPQSKQSMRSFALYLCTEGKPYLKTSLILPNSHTIKCRFFFMSFATFLQLFSRLYPSHFSLFVFIFCSHNSCKMNSLHYYFLCCFFSNLEFAWRYGIAFVSFSLCLKNVKKYHRTNYALYIYLHIEKQPWWKNPHFSWIIDE